MKPRLQALFTERMSMSEWVNPILEAEVIKARREKKLKIPKIKRTHRYLGYLKGLIIYWFYVILFVLAFFGILKIIEFFQS